LLQLLAVLVEQAAEPDGEARFRSDSLEQEQIALAPRATGGAMGGEHADLPVLDDDRRRRCGAHAQRA